MPRVPYNSVGGFSTGLTMTGVIDSDGNITGVGATFSGLIRANAGISASGITVGGSISFQNQEFIRNTTNGRMDFMPAPAGSTHYGMYMDFTSWSWGVKLGTIRASDNALNAAGFLWDAPLSIYPDVQFNLGSDGQYNIVRTAVGNDTAQFSVNCSSGQNSGAFALVDAVGQQQANRSPGVTHTNPNLYVYRSGSASANDFVRMEHDGTVGRIVSGGTSGINLEPGSGVLSVGGGISASGGFTFGSLSGTTFMVFKPTTSCTNGGLWIRDGNLQLGGSFQGSGQGAFYYSPCGEQFIVGGYSTFQNSYNYQSGRSPLRLNGAPTQSVPILAAYKQTSEGTQLSNVFTTVNMVAGIDQNGALFSTAGVCASGATFSGLIRANGGISAAGATFSGLINANAGINASGATFNGPIYTDTIFSISPIVSINDVANTRVSLGDFSGNANSTYIYLRDNANTIEISNPFGLIYLGDPNAIDSGTVITYDVPNGTFSGNGVNNLDGFQTISADSTILENNLRVTTNARSWFL